VYFAAAARPHAAPAQAYARGVLRRPARSINHMASVMSAVIGTSVSTKCDSRTCIGRTAISAAASSATGREPSSTPSLYVSHTPATPMSAAATRPV
jgi:hypothetical protein